MLLGCLKVNNNKPCFRCGKDLDELDRAVFKSVLGKPERRMSAGLEPHKGSQVDEFERICIEDQKQRLLLERVKVTQEKASRKEEKETTLLSNSAKRGVVNSQENSHEKSTKNQQLIALVRKSPSPLEELRREAALDTVVGTADPEDLENSKISGDTLLDYHVPSNNNSRKPSNTSQTPSNS